MSAADTLLELDSLCQQLPEPARGRADALIVQLAIAERARTQLEAAQWRLEASSDLGQLLSAYNAGRMVPLLPFLVHGAKAMDGNLKRGAKQRLSDSDRAADGRNVLAALERFNRLHGARTPYRSKVRWIANAAGIGQGRVEIALRAINAIPGNAVTGVVPTRNLGGPAKMGCSCDGCLSGVCLRHAPASSLFREAQPMRPDPKPTGVLILGPPNVPRKSNV